MRVTRISCKHFNIPQGNVLELSKFRGADYADMYLVPLKLNLDMFSIQLLCEHPEFKNAVIENKSWGLFPGTDRIVFDLIAPDIISDDDVEAINKGSWENCDDDAKMWADAMKVLEDTCNSLLRCPNRWNLAERSSVFPYSMVCEVSLLLSIKDLQRLLMNMSNDSELPVREVYRVILKEITSDNVNEQVRMYFNTFK